MDSPALLDDATVAQITAELARRPDDLALLLRLSVALNARNMPERAEDAARQILAASPGHGEAWYQIIIARSLFGPEAVSELVPELHALERGRPEDAAALRNRALLGYFTEDDGTAQELASRALELNPADAHADEVLAYLAYTVGDLDAAIEHGIKAIEIDPGNFRALHWLGECYAQLDARAQAERYFQRALRIDDGFFLALESLGSLCLDDPESHALGVQCFARILSINPRWFPAWFRLADSHVEHDRLGEAAAMAQAVLRLQPDDETRGDAHQYLGLVAFMQGTPDAREHFETALALSPRSAAAHYHLGLLAEREGRNDEAARQYRRACKLDEAYSLPRTRLGYLHFDAGELPQAAKAFRAAIEMDAEDYLAHLGLGEIARAGRDFAAQFEHCSRAAMLAPGDPNARNQLGTALDALGRHAEAAHEYEEALRLDPLNRQAANNLGHVYERMLETATGEEADRLRQAAIAAWTLRLTACRAARVSTRAAETHLKALGLTTDDIATLLSPSPT